MRVEKRLLLILPMLGVVMLVVGTLGMALVGFVYPMSLATSTCPYCGKNVVITRRDGVTCKSCLSRSVIRDGTLLKVEK